ncbi:box C/D snoRNA protein 1 [Agrilus planipennis]|uniref:Box C/D snoRNA protein 1 n=1 Tax=Agrilus planipennis TaxID=224129 RepID=A0A7F5R8X5_AGRPL|nr:box C/D snoRNA protein 1 [Agrilus planipennis]
MEVEQPAINTLLSDYTSRLGQCEVCSVTAAKYTCPRCELKTCCLKCSSIHKKELNCNGERDKTKYIPMDKFTSLDLSNDICMLEEISRTVEKLKKDAYKKFPKNSLLPYHLHRLQKAADRRKTVIKFLPPTFKRHINNSTYLQFKTNTLFWHIDWIFTNAENFCLTDRRVPESLKLSKIINKYFQLQEGSTLQTKLQFYQSAGIAGIKLLLKAEEKKRKQFYELDPHISLKDNLKNRLIIEYPVIHVVLNDHISCYEVIDSDLEEDEDLTDGNKVIQRIIEHSEKEENLLYKEFKNLLFLNENSDSEMSVEDGT